MPPAADAARPVGRHGGAEPAAARTGRALAESLPHAGDALPVRRAVPDRHPPPPVQPVQRGVRLLLCGAAQADKPPAHTAHRSGTATCRETAEAPVCRSVPAEGEPLQLPHEQRGGTGGDALHERIDLPREIQQNLPEVRQQMVAGAAHRSDTAGLEIPLRPPAQGDSREERLRVGQPVLGVLHGTDEAKPQRAAQGAVRRAVRGTAEVLSGRVTAFPAKSGTAAPVPAAIFVIHNRQK